MSTHIEAKLRYLHSSAEPTFLRNGRIGTKRGLDGNDEPNWGDETEFIDKLIRNGRQAKPTICEEGFQLFNFAEIVKKSYDNRTCALNTGAQVEQLLQHGTINFLDHADVVSRFYPLVQSFVKSCTGARDVFCFDHNIRRTELAAGKNSQIQVQPPINYVHTDYTITSAPRRLVDLTRPPKQNDALKSFIPEGKSLIPPEYIAARKGHDDYPTRYVMFNVWKSIGKEPIQQKPLALCSSGSLNVETDLVVFEIHYADRVGENWFVKHNKEHQWTYFPQMSFDEALLFKQWDSHGKIALDCLKKLDTIIDGYRNASDDPEKRGKSSTQEIAEDAAAVLSKMERFIPIEAKEKESYFESLIGSVGSSDFCIHSAIDDPNTPQGDIPPRESIEVRCFAFF